MICIIGFTAASMLCGAAQTLQQLVGFRLLQGMFGAALAPLSQATMLDIYPFSRRAQAMAIFSMGVTMGRDLAGFVTGTPPEELVYPVSEVKPLWFHAIGPLLTGALATWYRLLDDREVRTHILSKGQTNHV